MKKRIAVVSLAVMSLFVASACSQINPSSTEKDQKASQSILDGYQKAQPVPVMDWSQLRQNLIEIETAQAKTTQTTSFFFNQGAVDPVMTCPSIGFPIPSTYQLTNPDQALWGGNGASNVIPQIEANGVFTGDSAGTYVMCVNAEGKAYAMYWEGFVGTATAAATWDREAHQIKLIGAPTTEFTTKK